jgi:hypothetical protein
MTRILDPTVHVAVADAEPRAPRPPSLNGLTVGLLSNGKTHGMALLDRIAENLMARHQIAGVVRVTKRNASAPVEPDDAERLAKQCAVVVTAIGD